MVEIFFFFLFSSLSSFFFLCLFNKISKWEFLEVNFLRLLEGSRLRVPDVRWCHQNDRYPMAERDVMVGGNERIQGTSQGRTNI